MRTTTIKKYQIALQEFVDFIRKSNGIVNCNEISNLRAKHQVSATLWTDAVKLDIIIKTGKGTYKVIVDKIEPIHIRRLIQYRREYIRNKTSVSKKVGNVTKSFENKQIIDPTKGDKTISILWGLIVLKY